MIAAMVFSNLLYVVGAVTAATLVSGFVVFRHRRPKSLEAGIELFSRELKALQPDRHPTVNGDGAGGGPGGGGFPVIGGAQGQDRIGGAEHNSEHQVEPGPGARSRDDEPSGGALPGDPKTHVNLLATGTGNVRLSSSHEARAPSPDEGDQPG